MTEAYDQSRYLKDSLRVRRDSLLVRSNLVPLGYIVLEGIDVDGIKGVIAFSGTDASVKLGNIEMTGARNGEGVIQWELFNFSKEKIGKPYFQNEIRDLAPIRITQQPDQLELGLIR